ncbi:MAG: FHA domain-containing protein [Gemmataceae bacterium]|nr:FHA domain-containing protein [Gemmataceae bacterium]
MNSALDALTDTWSKLLMQYLMWIDGVGGFLLCLGPRITIGQASADKPPDVALLADVSRHHATIQRDAEGYFLEAIRKATINGQAAEKALLRPGDRITLGASCQLLFTQPAAISASARLDVVSGHRLQQPVNAVLLMAETLVIGPAPQAHVVAPDLVEPMVLYRMKDGIALRCSGPIRVNGNAHPERMPLPAGAQVVTDGLSFALEAAGKSGVRGGI